MRSELYCECGDFSCKRVLPVTHWQHLEIHSCYGDSVDYTGVYMRHEDCLWAGEHETLLGEMFGVNIYMETYADAL